MKRVLAFLLLACAWLAAAAQGVLPVPELTARVIDQTGTLDAIQRKGLEDKLKVLDVTELVQLSRKPAATVAQSDQSVTEE